VSSYRLENDLPAPLQDWLAAELERDYAPQENMVFAMLAPFLGFYIVGGFGLLLLKRWGAWLFLWSQIALSIATPFMGPNVEHAIVSTLEDLLMLLAGLIIGLAFFSDALASKEETFDIAE
jgi:uncharacterized membrane protein (DUF2068 family)